MFIKHLQPWHFAMVLISLVLVIGFTAVSAQTTSSSTFTVVEDAFGKEAPKENQNTDSFNYLKVGHDLYRETYLQFNVNGLDESVSQATLRIYAQNSGVGDVHVWSMPNSWSASTITLANAPTADELLNSISSFSTGWIEFDVTSAINGNGLVSFMLVSSSGDELQLDSLETENGNPAELIVETAPTTIISTITPVADAFTKDNKPDQNTGEFEYLKIEQNPQRDTYLKFDVSTVEGELNNATLRLYAQNGSTEGLTVSAVVNGWTELGLTYNDVPEELAFTHSTSAFDAGWLEIDVTSAFDDNQKISFRLIPNGNEQILFDSKETVDGNVAELVLTTIGNVSNPPTPIPPTPTPPTPIPPTADYFVATTGNDSHSGTEAQPFRNIQTAIDLAQPGDVIMVRGGVYHEVIAFFDSGSANNPITLMNYPGELPIIDGDSVNDPHGEYELPPVPASGFQTCNETVSPPKCFHYKPLVEIAASYIVFDGFEVRYSLGRGIWVHNKDYRINNIIIRNNRLHNNRNAGMKALRVDDLLFENNHVWNNSNYATHDRPAKVYNWTHAVNSLLSSNVTIRNNVVFENYGEGIGTGRGTINVTVTDNVLYDNKIQIYIHRSVDAVVDGNLAYCTNRPAFRRGGQPGTGIVLNNEYNFPELSLNDNIQVTNNLITGCRLGVGLWAGGGEIKTGSSNVIIAHNTIMNLAVNKYDSPDIEEKFSIGFNVSSGPHNNINVFNNIFYGAEKMASIGAPVTFYNNFWEKIPNPISAQHAQDVIGDPLFTNPTAPLTPGDVEASWFRIKANSPAINAASSSFVTVDYWNQSRGNNPDIGAHER